MLPTAPAAAEIRTRSPAFVDMLRGGNIGKMVVRLTGENPSAAHAGD